MTEEERIIIHKYIARAELQINQLDKDIRANEVLTKYSINASTSASQKTERARLSELIAKAQKVLDENL